MVSPKLPFQSPADCTVDPEFAEKFWSRVDVRGPGECWPWVGIRTASGYGRCCAKIPAEDYGRMHFAHRIALLLSGDMPPELIACHHCDNPPCCNPDHLYAGSQLMNMQDAARRNHGNRGQAHGMSKLNEDDVRAIRAQKHAGVHTDEVARQYGIGRHAVMNIFKRRAWKHI